MTQPKTPEPCPVCKGLCCVTGGKLKVEHGGGTFVLHYRHDCPDCEDGTRAPRPLTLIPAVKEERAAVLAWLRAGAKNHRGFGIRLIGDELEAYADAIERGEHRREEEKP